jgi:hypothetical protein
MKSCLDYGVELPEEKTIRIWHKTSSHLYPSRGLGAAGVNDMVEVQAQSQGSR